MDKYAKWFSKAALIYLFLGVLMGIAVGVNPEWSTRLRFIHIHFNLLGFMTMMIAGVAYHVLPRFNAKPLPWPGGVKYHFILQNVGLLGMGVTHMAGGLWDKGLLHVLFVLFALSAGAGLIIMAFNLFIVLLPAKETGPVTEITGENKVAEVLDRFPQALPLFLEAGFTSLANPVARQTFAKVVTLDKACQKHGVDSATFIRILNARLVPGRPGPSAPTPPAARAEETPQGGFTIQRGELCRLEVRVGSLIEVYPETKTVFEKHYGEGCFSCPGQVFETVEQTAQMHNVDPGLILEEVNQVIRSQLNNPRKK